MIVAVLFKKKDLEVCSSPPYYIERRIAEKAKKNLLNRKREVHLSSHSPHPPMSMHSVRKSREGVNSAVHIHDTTVLSCILGDYIIPVAKWVPASINSSFNESEPVIARLFFHPLKSGSCHDYVYKYSYLYSVRNLM